MEEKKKKKKKKERESEGLCGSSHRRYSSVGARFGEDNDDYESCYIKSSLHFSASRAK